jgi:hypothetical protein
MQSWWQWTAKRPMSSRASRNFPPGLEEPSLHLRCLTEIHCPCAPQTNALDCMLCTSISSERLCASHSSCHGHRVLIEVYPELVIPHSAQALLWLGSSCHLFRVQVKVPVCVFAFDCLYVDGESLLKRPLQERREHLAAALPGLRPGFVCLAQSHVLQSPAAPAPTPESAQPATQPPGDLSEQPVVRGGSPDALPCAVVPLATPDRLAARPTPDRADDGGAMEVDVPSRDDVMDDVTELGAAAVGAQFDF